MYQILAKYYDALVKDDQATQLYVDFILPYIKGKKTGIDYGCGSGEITIALHNLGFIMSGNDLSQDMLDCLNNKCHDIQTYCGDMKDISLPVKYDFALCICDSFNYLTKQEDVKEFFKHVYDNLNQHGVFICDSHHLDRLIEFKETWIEEGYIYDSQYQWTIVSDNDDIQQHFAFYTPQGLMCESHLQKVYDPEWIKMQLENCGFKVNIVQDFGIEDDSDNLHEKYFFIGEK